MMKVVFASLCGSFAFKSITAIPELQSEADAHKQVKTDSSRKKIQPDSAFVPSALPSPHLQPPL